MSNNTTNKISQESDTKQDIHQAEQSSPDAASITDTLAANIAHEFNTSLTIIANAERIIRKTLTPLIDGYKKAVHANLITPSSGETPAIKIQRYLATIVRCAEDAKIMIHLHLTNLYTHPIESDALVLCNLKAIIKEALEVYPIEPDERNLIHWQIKENIQFKGNPSLMKYILWNLIKNAIRAIKMAGKGEIRIWCKDGVLHIEDNALGMSPEQAAALFDKPLNPPIGTGLGLRFCQKVMNAFGGSIQCEAKEGAYAHFILKFLESEPIACEELMTP